MLFPFKVLPIVLGTVRPCFDSLSMLLVIEPLANIGGPVGMGVGAVAVSLIVPPLPLVDVSVGVDELSEAVSLVLLPLALILRSIGPHLMSVAVLHSIQPLASVDRSTRESHRWQRFSLTSIIAIQIVIVIVVKVVNVASCISESIVHAKLPWLRLQGTPCDTVHLIRAVVRSPVSLLVLCGSSSAALIQHHVLSLHQCRADLVSGDDLFLVATGCCPRGVLSRSRGLI